MTLRRWRGAAGDFHARDLGAPAEPEVWVVEADRPALVLGSSQPAATVDEAAVAAAGLDLVRRRSGGGAVLVEPGDLVWFDAVVPVDRLRTAGVVDDVAAAMRWFGEHLAAAADTVGIAAAAVHAGPMVTTPWSAVVCFDGLGPGELVVDDAKLVGVSARRTRAATRFQCALPLVWRPARLVAMLASPQPTVAELRRVAVASPDAAVRLPGALAQTLA